MLLLRLLEAGPTRGFLGPSGRAAESAKSTKGERRTPEEMRGLDDLSFVIHQLPLCHSRRSFLPLNDLRLTSTNGPMDQAIFHLINERWTSPGARLVHGRDQQPGDLEAGPRRGWRFMRWFSGDSRAAPSSFACWSRWWFPSNCSCARSRAPSIAAARSRFRPCGWSSWSGPVPQFLTLFKKPTIRFSDETDHTKSGPSFPFGARDG